MKSKWKVSSQYIAGEAIYQVYRQRDVSKVDHSGNREYYGRIFETARAAREFADELNEKQG